MQGWCGEVTVAEGEADEALLRGRRIGTLFEYSSWLIPIDWLAELPLDGGMQIELGFRFWDFDGLAGAWRNYPKQSSIYYSYP